jgi:hypothetical protein
VRSMRRKTGGSTIEPNQRPHAEPDSEQPTHTLGECFLYGPSTTAFTRSHTGCQMLGEKG